MTAISFTVLGDPRPKGIACALAADFTPIAEVVVPGNPPSKARPRFSRRGGAAYTDPVAKQAEVRTAAILRQAVRSPLDGSLVMVCGFYRRTYQRIDVDNMLKHVCDAANRILWRDDSQVKALAGYLEHDAENPRTVVLVGRTTTGMVRPSESERECAHCGKAFRSFMPKAAHCSVACANKSRGEDLAQPRACFCCGVTFKARTAGQRFCSDACRVKNMVGLNRRRALRPKSTCATCGVETSRPEYKRCRACWKSAASAAPVEAA